MAVVVRSDSSMADTFSWSIPGLVPGLSQNGGLARRHAVALKIEKPGAKGCLGGIASAGWLEDHQIQSFSREKLS